MSEVSLLVNPFAGQGLKHSTLEQAVRTFKQKGVNPEILIPETIEDSRRFIESVASNHGRLIVYGGDGLVNQAIETLSGTSSVLGILPAGTGNDAARALGLLTGSLSQLIDRALSEPVPIDLLSTGNQLAITSIICGFPAAVNIRANRLNFPSGSNRYTLATLLELPKMRSQTYKIIVDNDHLQLSATAIIVSNTAFFGGGMRISPDADPTDGLLDICIIGDIGQFDMLKSLIRVMSGTHIFHSKVTMLQAKKIKIIGDGKVRADGEDSSNLPIQITTKIASLLVSGATTKPPGIKDKVNKWTNTLSK